MLRGVNTWVIDPDTNIAMQFGDCTGLTIGGISMSGYSGYFDNIYITGTIKWLEDNVDLFKGDTGATGPAGTDGTDANLLPWVEDWNNNKTIINGTSIVSPKIFSGVKNADDTITGVAIGRDVITIGGINHTGIYAMDHDVVKV